MLAALLLNIPKPAAGSSSDLRVLEKPMPDDAEILTIVAAAEEMGVL